MPAIGITGGISTGKTSFVECLRELLPDAQFFDADQAARELGDKDPEVRGLIEKEFGDVYSAKGVSKPSAIATPINFFLLISHSCMKPAVKPCAIELWSWPLRRASSSSGL